MPLEVGGVLRDTYLLDASIGQGGMGEVFSATDLTTGRRVAIKVVRHADAQLMARLHREADATLRIRSAFVPELLRVDTSEDGELFLVMELLIGETLAQRLMARRVLPWADVARIGDDVLSGLVDAHAAGVVHRDLKPGNVFLETGESDLERARVLDFGFCKLDRSDESKLTTTGEAVGTIAYMAPEQVRGASSVDARADLYAFAVLVFEALSGRLPFEGVGQVALLVSKLERKPRALREAARVSVPEGLDALVARCLARKREDRPASALELRHAWRALGAATCEAAVRPSEPPGRSSSGIALAVAVFALLASAVVLVVTGRPRPHAARVAPPPRVATASRAPSARAPTWAPAPTLLDAAPPPSVEIDAGALPKPLRGVKAR